MKLLTLILGLTLYGGILMAETLPKHYERTLKNDLQVVVIPLKNQSNVISTHVIYKVGSRNEIMGKSGIAHMLEHLNFKSTKNLKAGEFDETIKRFGGSTNAFTSFDYTNYYIKSSTQNLEKSLELFAELMQNLSLKDEEFQPERNVVAEERRWRTDNNPMGYLYFRLFNTAYVYHPYHWTPIGFMEDIQTWSIEDIRNFHKTYYQPKNAIVVVAGDVDPERVFTQTEKYFGNIKNTTELPKFYQVEPEQDGQRRLDVHKETEIEYLALGFKTPPFNDKKQIAISAIAEILGNGKSARLPSVLIDKKRLVSEIYAYNMDLIDNGLFIIIAQVNPGVKPQDVEQEILKQLQGLSKVSNEELEKVKINLKSSLIHQLQSSSSVANLYSSYLARGDLGVLSSLESDFSKLDKKTLEAVAKEIFDPMKSTVLVLQK